MLGGAIRTHSQVLSIENTVGHNSFAVVNVSTARVSNRGANDVLKQCQGKPDVRAVTCGCGERLPATRGEETMREGCLWY